MSEVPGGDVEPISLGPTFPRRARLLAETLLLRRSSVNRQMCGPCLVLISRSAKCRSDDAYPKTTCYRRNVRRAADPQRLRAHRSGRWGSTPPARGPTRATSSPPAAAVRPPLPAAPASGSRNRSLGRNGTPTDCLPGVYRPRCRRKRERPRLRGHRSRARRSDGRPCSCKRSPHPAQHRSASEPGRRDRSLRGCRPGSRHNAPARLLPVRSAWRGDGAAIRPRCDQVFRERHRA